MQKNNKSSGMHRQQRGKHQYIAFLYLHQMVKMYSFWQMDFISQAVGASNLQMSANCVCVAVWPSTQFFTLMAYYGLMAPPVILSCFPVKNFLGQQVC